MAFAPLIFMAASAAVSVAGSLSAGAAAKKQGEANAQINEMNAQAAREQAKMDAAKHRTSMKRVIGSQIAGYGGSGVMNTGTALDVQQDAAVQGELDALTIEYGGTMKSNYYMAAAAQARQQGRDAQQASYFQAAGTLLSTAGKMYGGSMLGGTS